ncbi:hypothetical protein BaRGS_00021066, partial [Batillaria attramentaria]
MGTLMFQCLLIASFVATGLSFQTKAGGRVGEKRVKRSDDSAPLQAVVDNLVQEVTSLKAQLVAEQTARQKQIADEQTARQNQDTAILSKL